MNVTNVGAVTARSAAVSILDFLDIQLPSGDATIYLGDIAPGQTVLTPISINNNNPARDTIYTELCIPGTYMLYKPCLPYILRSCIMVIHMRINRYPGRTYSHLSICLHHSHHQRRSLHHHSYRSAHHSSLHRSIDNFYRWHRCLYITRCAFHRSSESMSFFWM